MYENSLRNLCTKRHFVLQNSEIYMTSDAVDEVVDSTLMQVCLETSRFNQYFLTFIITLYMYDCTNLNVTDLLDSNCKILWIHI